MVKGIIIEQNHEKAENLKILFENTDPKLPVTMKILNETERNYNLKDIRSFDFMVTQVKSLNEKDMRRDIIPYLKALNNKKKDLVKLTIRKKIIFIDRNNIVGLEVLDKNCYVHTFRGTYMIGRITLKQLIELLEEPHIIRCHRSFAINLKFIRGFHKESRNRWKPVFAMETKFDCTITELFMDDVVARFEELNPVNLSKSYFEESDVF